MEAIMHSRFDHTDTDTTSTTQPRMRPQTWRERHALTIMGIVMAAMFATVIVAQVAC
jgi:hypothetical protein